MILMALSYQVIAQYEWRKELPFVERNRKLPHTLIFSQAQLKYPLNTAAKKFSYYERWTDWPLFISSKLNGGQSYSKLTDQGYELTVDIAKLYGLDGFTVFLPSNHKIAGQKKLWQLNDKIDKNFMLAPMWGGVDKEQALCLPLESKSSLKIEGKSPVFFYSGFSPEKYKEIISKVKDLHGDKFIFLLTDLLYSSTFAGKFHNNTLKEADILNTEDKIRKLLRVGDGFYFSRRPRDYESNGCFDQPLYELMARIITKVMAEPEFKDKYLALTVGAEHCNSYLRGYSLYSDGTRTFRNFMSTALKYNPDFIIIPEWDEVNENSQLRPFVFNGLALMRITRYYARKIKEKDNYYLPDDDLSIPNLIVSTRKSLALGERLKIELLNVPDNDIDKKYNVILNLNDITGKNVHSFPQIIFSSNKLEAIDCVLPSEQFANQPVLTPEIELQNSSGTSIKKITLSAINLLPVSNHDYKYVRQAVRDIIAPSKSTIEINKNQDGTVKISADINFSQKVRYLEILENGCCVYSYTTKNLNWRDNKNYAVLDISLMSALAGRNLAASGDITVNCPEAKWRCIGVVSRGLRTSNNKLYFNNLSVNNWEARALVAIPREKLSQAQITVNIPGYCQKDFSYAELIQKQNYVFNGPNGFMLSFNRQYRQAGHVEPQDRNDFNFETTVYPENPNSVFQLQAITPAGKMWRSKPLMISQNNGQTDKRTITVFSDTTNQPVKLEIKASRVPEIKYNFNKENGTTMTSDAGRSFWASRGGFLLHANFKGGGATGLYGITGCPVIRSYPENADNTIPELVTENNETVLKFDGKGNFLTLPQNILPRHAGFTVEMDIFPEAADDKERLLFGATTCRGAHGGLRVFVKNGMLSYEFMNKIAKRTYRITDIKLPAGQWTRLSVKYDLKNVSFSLNGKPCGSYSCPGPGICDTITAVGGFGKGESYFKGKIKSLTIKHFDNDK